MSSYNAAQACIVENNLKPPGICTPAQHAALEKEKDKHCSGKRTCKGVPFRQCVTLLQNIKKNENCALAREKVMVTCFPPMGNKGHRMAVTEALNAAVYCERRYYNECRQKAPQPKPVPVPAPSKDFMKKMEQVTGLAGTALIIYLIISEGTRLFPPRNLVPIP